MKKRLVSVFMILTIITSLFAVSAVNSNAAMLTPAPTSLSCSNQSNGIRVTWSDVSSASRYILFYKTASTPNWSRIFTPNTSYPFLKAQSGTTYYFQVQSIGKGGTYGNYSKVLSWKYIATPTAFGGRIVDKKNLQMYWNAIPGAQKYQLVRWNANSKSWDEVYYGSSTSVIDTRVASGEFIYSVRALSGNTASCWSKQAYPVLTPQITIYDGSFAFYRPAKNIFEKTHYHYDIYWSNEGYSWEVAFYTTDNHKTPALKKYSTDTNVEFDDTRHFDLVVVRHKFGNNIYNKGLGIKNIPVAGGYAYS